MPFNHQNLYSVPQLPLRIVGKTGDAWLQVFPITIPGVRWAKVGTRRDELLVESSISGPRDVSTAKPDA